MAVYIFYSRKRDDENPSVFDLLELQSCNHWRVYAIAITLAWINLIVYMRQIELIGKHIIILSDILSTFVTFLGVFAIFIIAFTFGFYVLLYSTDKPFMTLQDTFLKTLIMMSGEFDYGDIFYSGDGGPPFPLLTYFFFIVFFLLLNLIFLNLLIGLSVNDVNVYFERAEIQKVSMRLDFVVTAELLIITWLGAVYIFLNILSFFGVKYMKELVWRHWNFPYLNYNSKPTRIGLQIKPGKVLYFKSLLYYDFTYFI